MNVTFLLALLAVLLLGCERAPEEAPTGEQSIAVEADHLGLGDLKLDSAIVGDLEYRGGLRLRSSDSRFGGLSWLDISPDGRSLVALSDRGYRLRGELVYDAKGHLAGIVHTTIETLERVDERLFTGEEGCDCEAVARAPGGGWVIAFDRGRRLLVYPAGKEAPRSMPAPDDLQDISVGGITAIALMPDDRLFALASAPVGLGGLFGWVGNQDGWSRVTYATCARRAEDLRHKTEAAQCFPQQQSVQATGDLEEFWPAGATATPGGDILVVESGFPYVATRLRRVKAGQIRAGAVLEVEELAILEGSLAFHNIRGISARLAGTGETLIYLVSDDNFTGPQPTALVMFELRRGAFFPTS